MLIEDIAESYNEEDILAIDETYPGIFEPSEGQIQGRVDLIVDIPEEYNRIKVVEASSISTLSPEFIEGRYVEQAEQLQDHIAYFEGLGYKVEPEVELIPQDKLMGLKNFWQNTKGVTTWEGAKEAIGDDDVAGNMKNQGILVFDGINEKRSELYTVNQEIEEYDELIDLFNQGII